MAATFWVASIGGCNCESEVGGESQPGSRVPCSCRALRAKLCASHPLHLYGRLGTEKGRDNIFAAFLSCGMIFHAERSISPKGSSFVLLREIVVCR